MDQHQYRCARVLLAVLLGLPLSAQAMEPLRSRPMGSAQADGQLHSLRTIPEACTRLQGQFGGAAGYVLEAVPSAVGCPRRARFLPPGSVEPRPQDGWVLDEVIAVPSARCPARHLRLEVWTLPAAPVVAERDGQGQVRVYLEQARQQAAAGRLPPQAAWTARWQLEGDCAPVSALGTR